MNRVLLPFAMLATVCCAARAEPPLTVYGVIDAGIKYDDSGAAPLWSVAPNNRLGSRLGVRGAESLGATTKAVFTLEGGFNPDDGALNGGGRLWGRQAWIGLETSAGTVLVGRQYSATYLALRAIDPFKNQEAGDAQRVMGYGLAKTDPLARSDNTLTYASPSRFGWQMRAGVKLGEAADGLRTNSGKFVGVYHESEAWVAHFSLQDSDGLPLGAAAGVLGPLIGTAGAPAQTARARVGFAGLVFGAGPLKLHAGYGRTALSAARQAAIGNALAGVTLPVAGGTVILSWNRVGVRGLAGGAARQAGAGYARKLGKRTELYLSASRTSNGAALALNTSARGRAQHEIRAGVCHGF